MKRRSVTTMALMRFEIIIVIISVYIIFVGAGRETVFAAGSTYYVDDDYGNPPPGSGTLTDPYHKIQMGIDAASVNDTVQVAAGIYVEHIVINEKNGVMIQGAGAGDDPSIHSIIDGGGTIEDVVLTVDLDATTKIDGFKITNGSSPSGETGMCNVASSPTVTNCIFSGNALSGMVNSFGSSPTVTNCTFLGNSASMGYGGGMHNDNGSSPTVSNCTFLGNSARYGGGMCNYANCSPTVTNCTFSGNTAEADSMNGYGGGMYNYADSSPTVTNCTFFGNRADVGAGIYSSGSSIIVTNCILWMNRPNIFLGSPSPVVSYSDIEGFSIFPGEGNIMADPLFVDPDGPDDIPGTRDDDLHLTPGSHCIDAGTSDNAPIVDMSGNPRYDDPDTEPNMGGGMFPYFDMGAFEYLHPCQGDFDNDSDVDGADLQEYIFDSGGLGLDVFAANFGKVNCP